MRRPGGSRTRRGGVTGDPLRHGYGRTKADLAGRLLFSGHETVTRCQEIGATLLLLLEFGGRL
jgi:hypothetical protein